MLQICKLYSGLIVVPLDHFAYVSAIPEPKVEWDAFFVAWTVLVGIEIGESDACYSNSKY
jgi:hypothetical protein